MKLTGLPRRLGGPDRTPRGSSRTCLPSSPTRALLGFSGSPLGAARRGGEARATARRGPRTRELAPSPTRRVALDVTGSDARRSTARRAARRGAARPARNGEQAGPRVRKLAERGHPEEVRRGTLGQSLLEASGSRRSKVRRAVSYHQAATRRAAGLKISLMKIRKSPRSAFSNLYRRGRRNYPDSRRSSSDGRRSSGDRCSSAASRSWLPS